jgi:TonB family protein
MLLGACSSTDSYDSSQALKQVSAFELIPPPPLPDSLMVYVVVEHMPRFVSIYEDMNISSDEKYECAAIALLEFIYQNVKYPPEDREKNIQGLVVVEFVVWADGSIRDAKIVRSPSPYMGAAVLDVISLMDSWVAGVQKNKKVNVSYTIPVRFGN